MSKALIVLMSMIVQNCHGVFELNLDGSIIVYVFTPYDECGNVNPAVVPQQAEYLTKRLIKNIHILGFYGQGPIIGLEERKTMTSAWVKECNRLGCNVIVEIGAMPFPDQVELAKFCSRLNVTAISAFPLQVYDAKTKEEILEDYQRLSDAAPNLPLMYDAYTKTGPTITPAEAVITLMERVKTLAGAIVSIDSVLDIEAAVPSISGYQMWIYGNRAIVPSLALKLNGSVVNLPNFCPKLALEMESHVKAGNIHYALHLQQQENRLIQAIYNKNDKKIEYQSRTYFQYLRATCELFTGIELGSRLPFEKVSASELDTIRSNLEEFDDFINCYCK